MSKIPFHFVIFSLFPILSLYDHNKDMLGFSSIYRTSAISILFAFGCFFFFFLLFRNKYRASTMTSLIILAFFSFGHLLNYFYMHGLGSHLNILDYYLFINLCYALTFIVIGIILFGGLLFIVKMKKVFTPLTGYLNIVSLFLIIFIVFNLTVYTTKTNVDSSLATAKDNAIDSKHLPDIYWVILDGYGRQDILKNIYNLNNDGFLSELEKRQFFVAKSANSNYAQTYLSLASTSNFSYLDENNLKGLATKISDRLPVANNIKDSKLINTLKNKGYKIIATPTPWTGVQGNIKSEVKFTGTTLNEFERILIDTTPLRLYFNNKRLTTEHRNIIRSSLKSLKKISLLDATTLTISHIYSPHPPFVFDKNGRDFDSKGGFWKADGISFVKENPNNPTIEDYRIEYSAQLQYINKLTLQVIDSILANSETPPIIILQSDHGPGSMLDWEHPENTNMHERMSILNAYYVPEEAKAMLYDSISPVNSFRVVFNTLFDAELELLEDRSYFSRWSRPYDFIDVTEEVKNY